MASLSLRHVGKIYSGGVKAVDDFNLEIQDREFIILVGPSGCGKSTTLRMIAGLEEISEGEIYIDEKLVNNIHPKDRDIAMVFQNYALYAHMTAFENMAFSLKIRKYPKAEIKEKVFEAAKILNIENLLDRKPKQLSGGQRQRVALGRAIVRNPKVFLMDEPLSNLDAKLRVQMRTEISKLHHKLNATIIYVTHDQIEAMTMGTRIVVMKDGIIQQVDNADGLYNDPQNLFVAGFIGSPQMNFIDSTIEEEGGVVKALYGDKAIILPADKQGILRDQGFIGKQVVLGVRSEDIHVVRDGIERTLHRIKDLNSNSDEESVKTSEFSSTIDVVETLGSEKLLYFTISGRQAVAKAAANLEVAVDETCNFVFDTSKMYMFDKETEAVIK